ncbi:MAG: hypothetical protein QXR62_05025 [Candidatus Bathyarchaeia archaeon]
MTILRVIFENTAESSPHNIEVIRDIVLLLATITTEGKGLPPPEILKSDNEELIIRVHTDRDTALKIIENLRRVYKALIQIRRE